MIRFADKRNIGFPLLLAVAVMFLWICQAAAKDKDKTGYEKDDVFHDNRYGYSFEVPKDWKVGKTYKDPDDKPSPDRVMIYRKKFRIPVKLQEHRELVQRPTVFIAIDSTNLPPAQFFQQVSTAHDLNDFESAIVSKSVLFERGVETPPEVMETLPVTIGGHSATRWEVRLQYAHRLDTSFGTQSVRDWKVGYVYLVPLDGVMMYIEQVCENQSFDTLEPEFETMTKTLKFAGESGADSTATTTKTKSDGEQK